MIQNLFEPTALFIFVIVSFFGAVLALSRSSWFVDYAFLIVAFNRCVRRIVDYNNDFFNPYSLISLTPLVVCGFGALAVLSTLVRASTPGEARIREILLPYSVAVAFAFAIGIFNNKLGAIYSLGEFLAPIGFVAFGAWFAHDSNVSDRWCKNFCLIAFAVASYGLWQFYTIPPWDAFWLLAVNFDGYMGQPEPTKMTLFSTLQERGPTGMFLAGGLILLILRGVFPYLFRWPMAMVIGYAMLLTYTRTSVILCIASCILFPVINRNANFKVLLGAIVFLTVVAPIVVQRLPGSDTAIARVSTLANMQEDGSFRGRLALLRYSLGEALYEPLGLGLGSHGLAAKVSASTKAGMGDSTGYVQTLRTFGWVGTALVALCLARLWRDSSYAFDQMDSDNTVLFFRAWFAAGMVVFYSGDWIFTATFFWVLGGYVLGKVGEYSSTQFEDEWNDDFSGEGVLRPGDRLQHYTPTGYPIP